MRSTKPTTCSVAVLTLVTRLRERPGRSINLG
jgi:hypothetical protein